MTIDYTKSIQQRKVVTVKTHWTEKASHTSFYFIHIAIIGVFITLPPYMFSGEFTISELIRTEVGAYLSIFFGIIFLLGIHLMFCLFYWPKLTRIKGSNKETNKEIFLRIIQEHYPRLNCKWGDNILTGRKPYGEFSNGLDIIALFSDKDVYVNISSPYKHGPNIWMTPINLSRIAKIRKLFLEAIEN